MMHGQTNIKLPYKSVWRYWWYFGPLIYQISWHVLL